MCRSFEKRFVPIWTVRDFGAAAQALARTMCLAWLALLGLSTSASAQSIFECQWSNGNSSTYKVSATSFQFWRQADGSWSDMPCSTDNRFFEQPVCEVEITGDLYAWTATWDYQEPGVVIMRGFDQVVIDRRTGEGVYKEYGGTHYVGTGETSGYRDSATPGKCRPIEDPALRPRPAPVL